MFRANGSKKYCAAYWVSCLLEHMFAIQVQFFAIEAAISNLNDHYETTKISFTDALVRNSAVSRRII